MSLIGRLVARLGIDCGLPAAGVQRAWLAADALASKDAEEEVAEPMAAFGPCECVCVICRMGDHCDTASCATIPDDFPAGVESTPAPPAGSPSPRQPMLTVVDRLTDIAADARLDARVARADGDNERREYLMGEHRGLMEAAEVLLAFDWTAAWREACTVRTLAELDALPLGSMVMTVWDPAPHHVMTRFSDGWYGWPSRDMPLYPLGSGCNGQTVLLVWHPDWDAAAQKHSGGS